VDRVALGSRSLTSHRQAHLSVASSLTVAEYLAPRWLARRPQSIEPSELASTDLVLRESGSGTRQTLAQALSTGGLELGQSHLEVASAAAVKAAALAGDAPAELSNSQ